ncbi:toxin TcdB middle/N-terminal domain-containing protein [Glaciecola sp. SC05]|uniref:toxin TcdB middle/N-terminal domain-containing protein n=1 Tax=Glaciecola sp. SC05 TaxID=1987355 RepID=UPI0035296699
MLINLPFTSSMYVVHKVDTTNGVGGINSTTFSYDGAMYNTQGRGFRGFNAIAQTHINSANGSNESITFEQFIDSINSMMSEFDKKMQALAEEMNKNSASFASGLIDGAASIPKAYYRANIAAADAYGLNGEAKEAQFRLRTRLFDLTANKFIHDSEFREQVFRAIRSYHTEVFDAISLVNDSKRSYILGRFTGRMAIMRKLNMQQKSAIYLGDFYHGVTRAGDGLAVLPERLVMGDLISEVGVE